MTYFTLSFPLLFIHPPTQSHNPSHPRLSPRLSPPPIPSYPSPSSSSTHPHNLTTPHILVSLPVSLHLPSPQNHQAATEEVSSKINSSTASIACEWVRVTQSWQKRMVLREVLNRERELQCGM